MTKEKNRRGKFELGSLSSRKCVGMFEQGKQRAKLRLNVLSHLSNTANFHSKLRSIISFRRNCRLKIPVVGNNRHHELSRLFIENSLPSKIRYFFVEKPGKAANFGEIRLHYFCTILYNRKKCMDIPANHAEQNI